MVFRPDLVEVTESIDVFCAELSSLMALRVCTRSAASLADTPAISLRRTGAQALNQLARLQTNNLEGEAGQRERAMVTVWIYTNTSKQVGDPDQLKVFAGQDDADKWLRTYAPDGVAFQYPVIGELYERMIRRPPP
jgi:hypothetical protein